MTLKLKDYEKAEIDRVYHVNNLYLVYDGAKLLSKYPQETMWHLFDETDEFFAQIQEREMIATDAYMS